MAVAALDTLSLTKRLRAAGFTEDQAEAVTDVVREASAVDTSSLATKSDLAELRSATKADLAELRSATKADLAELRTTTEAGIAELRTTAKADLAELKAEILKWMFGAIGLQTIVILGALVTLVRIGLRP